MTVHQLPDPTTLVFAAPVISEGEDWRARSLTSWLILADHAGIKATATDAGGRGFPPTWCGNVSIDGLVYRVQRAPRLRMAMFDEQARQRWVLHSATYVEPVTTAVEVIDPRQGRMVPSVGADAFSTDIDLRTVALPTHADRLPEPDAGSAPA